MSVYLEMPSWGCLDLTRRRKSDQSNESDVLDE
jgi:hypothetical protein